MGEVPVDGSSTKKTISPETPQPTVATTGRHDLSFTTAQTVAADQGIELPAPKTTAGAATS